MDSYIFLLQQIRRRFETENGNGESSSSNDSIRLHTGLSVSWVLTQQKNMALNQRQQIVKMLDKMGNSHREIHTSNETRRSGLFNGIKNMWSKLLISMRKWHFNFQNITVSYAHGIWISFLVWSVPWSFRKPSWKFQTPQLPTLIEFAIFWSPDWLTCVYL